MADQGSDSALFAGLDDPNGLPSSLVDGYDNSSSVNPTIDSASASGRAPVTTASAPGNNETSSSPVLLDGSQSFFSPTPDWPLPQDTPPYDAFESGNPLENLNGFPQWPIQTGPVPPQAYQFRPFFQQPVEQLRPSQSPIDLNQVPVYAGQMSNPPPGNPVNGEHTVRPNLPPEILSTLTPAQQEKLKSIAMPAHLQYHSPKSEASPDSSNGDINKFGSPRSPDAADMSKASSRKRKSSADDDDDDDEDEDGENQPVKKTAHNMIEKRYRTNLNDKIAALRDSVPSLRIMSKSARGEDTTEDREELHGLTPAHKLNKATVLSKATEYIRHLEKRNNRLMDENGAMQQRIAAFEKLFMAGAMNGTMSPMQQPPTPMQYPQDSSYMNTPMGTPRGPDPQGMIQVPDDMKRIIDAQMAAGRPYPIPAQNFQQNPALLRQQQIQQQQQMQANRWQNTGPYFGKLMVGSLAGLMILEAARENEQSNEKPEGRGLFALPLQVLGPLVSGSHFSVAGYQFATGQVLHTLKLLLLFGALLWAFVPSLFAPKPPKSQKPSQTNASLQAVPSLASPIHVRRQAWLTAIQTVWVPQHNFILEAAALILKTMKLSLRNTIGVHGYQMLTGLTEEQETARVQAWSIALDAQLAGGDVEINKSRLTLTLLASGTLPETPLRLMLKALHIRVLLWQLGKHGVHNTFAAKLARSKWNEARQLYRMMNQLRRSEASSDEELPEHLAILLEQDCDEVLNEDIVQRANNLAWNRSTTYDVVVDVDGMNAVVEDPAVRSPMDAVAAWWSCLTLQRVLTTSLSEEPTIETAALIDDEVNLAIKAAPIGSNAQVRAIVARAVLVEEKRGANIAVALQAMGPTLNPDKHPQYSKGVPPLIESPMSSILPDPDVQMALRCAMAIAHLQRFEVPPRSAISVIDGILPGPADGMSLLGCTGAFQLMQRLHQHPVAAEACTGSLERLAAILRIWIGSAEGDKPGLDQEIRHKMVDCCITITKSVVGMEEDPGYGSMSDCDSVEGAC
ncbi:Sterol regulatory element-binding protein 1 [Pleurostoma richardsiae]|uniref:Sterol regulatory element-binding protein 1 n=1 Tax=Pleurostoma richardsiae TaxID=41990 RepID=A0AA38RZL9_9PEZI|nr:Sterol regulatory element-binding protein 1 [Pleurostoma richardsiae]